MTRPRSAPSAIRMPISRVRRVTAYDMTPYSPIAASSVAKPPKAVDSAATMRSTNSDSSTWTAIVFISKIGRFASRR